MNSTYTWYQTLIKPTWAPPAWLFGPVWTVLYAIIAISFGVLFYKTIKKQIPFSVALPFVLNLVFNFAFTPIQFGLQNNALALIDVSLVVITLVWGMIVLWNKVHHMRWVVFINIPYVLWGTFATILQTTITILNW
jgi:tryptophan-rich sensory protein